MTVKRNRNNSNFQIAYFVAGSCHTADAAYIALLNQRDERERALDQVEPGELRQQAIRIRSEQRLQSTDPAERLEAQAELLELERSGKNNAELVAAAREELSFITECIQRLQPFRKYAHLSDAEAAEACQQEEWALELQRRAENYMLTSGTIPHDHFNTMRQHPDFAKRILPHIEQLHLGMQTPGGMLRVIADRSSTVTLPAMLGLVSPSEEETKPTQGDH
jgi:hypothetical protein